MTDRLPVPLGPVSNSEWPPAVSPLAAEAARRTRAAVEVNARRRGMSRREFLRSVCGTATSLAVLSACAAEEAATRGTAPGGTFAVDPEATVDPDAAAEALGGDEVIVDVQTHLLEMDTTGPVPPAWFGQGFPQAGCGADDPRECFSTRRWILEVFGQSDTSVAVISAIPVVADPDPLSVAVMDAARRQAEALGCTGRVLISGQIFPSLGRPAEVWARMEATAASFDLAVWKVYTHVPAPAWRLDDADADLPAVGAVFLEGVRRTGIPVVAVHKGFGDHRLASPADVGPAAAANPDLTFIVYHSGYEPSHREGPYDPAGDAGVDRLIASLDTAGIGPDGNVYAELGSTWFNVMRDPDAAGHLLGKLLAHLGPERIIWGTDSIWYGSPQPQIEAFRAFRISEEHRERHGYPELTDEARRLILGGNAARLFGIDPPPSARCRLSPDELAELRQAMPAGVTHGPTTAAAARARFAADHPWIRT